MRFEFVDRGGSTTGRDPIRSLATALGAAGHSVRLFSTQPPRATIPGLETVRLSVREGTDARTRAGLGRTLGALLDPAATATIVPHEFAGLKGASASRLITVLPPLDAAPVAAASGGWLDRFFGRRSARKEEALALQRARWILAPGEVERRRFVDRTPGAGPRTAVLPVTVPMPPETPDRGRARRDLRIPDDVPVATYLGPPDDPAAAALARAAFQRARVFFPGARLVLPGVPAPAEPGVHSLAGADAAARRGAARAADLLVAPVLRDPTELLGHLRTGLPAILGPGVELPRPAGKLAVRRSETDDPGALASDLAELLADPVLRRRIGEAGREYADGYAPERATAQFLTLAT